MHNLYGASIPNYIKNYQRVICTHEYKRSVFNHFSHKVIVVTYLTLKSLVTRVTVALETRCSLRYTLPVAIAWVSWKKSLEQVLRPTTYDWNPRNLSTVFHFVATLVNIEILNHRTIRRFRYQFSSVGIFHNHLHSAKNSAILTPTIHSDNTCNDILYYVYW